MREHHYPHATWSDAIAAMEEAMRRFGRIARLIGLAELAQEIKADEGEGRKFLTTFLNKPENIACDATREEMREMTRPVLYEIAMERVAHDFIQETGQSDG